MTVKFINANVVYQRYRLARSFIRELADCGIVERREMVLPSGKVMYTYSAKDIEKYLNEQ